MSANVIANRLPCCAVKRCTLSRGCSVRCVARGAAQGPVEGGRGRGRGCPRWLTSSLASTSSSHPPPPRSLEGSPGQSRPSWTVHPVLPSLPLSGSCVSSLCRRLQMPPQCQNYYYYYYYHILWHCGGKIKEIIVFHYIWWYYISLCLGILLYVIIFGDIIYNYGD